MTTQALIDISSSSAATLRRDEVALRPEVLEAGHRHGSIAVVSAEQPSTSSMPNRPGSLAGDEARRAQAALRHRWRGWSSGA